MRNKFKLISAIFILAAGINAYAQQYWTEVPCPTTKFLKSLSFPDSLNGWAGGDSNTIVHTSNGGASWFVQYDGSLTYSIDDIFFSDDLNGWALWNDYELHGTGLVKTTNGGLNWILSRYPDTTLVLQAIYFMNSQTGFFGGYNALENKTIIVKTTNGGSNWTRSTVFAADSCNQLPILRIKFLDSLTGYATGGFIDRGGLYWKTTDAGFSWRPPVQCVSGEPLWDFYEIDQNRKVVTGGDYDFGASNYIMKDGVTWMYYPFNILGIPHRITRRTVSEFWVPCGTSGFFAISTDTSAHWSLVQLQDSLKAIDAAFINERIGWAVGGKGIFSKGAIMKYNTAIIGIDPVTENSPSEFVLYQNYPNPFNPTTEISYYLPVQSRVTITFYDALGRKTSSVFRGLEEGGRHSFEFDAGNLASGIYFYSLITDGPKGHKEFTKKMVLLK